MPIERPVIVCTKSKAVIFGYVEEYHNLNVITIKRARMCLYWSADMKGIFGLAKMGPSKECRISEQCPEIEARDIEGVISVTPEAVKRWEAAPWKA